MAKAGRKPIAPDTVRLIVKVSKGDKEKLTEQAHLILNTTNVSHYVRWLIRYMDNKKEKLML